MSNQDWGQSTFTHQLFISCVMSDTTRWRHFSVILIQGLFVNCNIGDQATHRILVICHRDGQALTGTVLNFEAPLMGHTIVPGAKNNYNLSFVCWPWQITNFHNIPEYSDMMLGIDIS